MRKIVKENMTMEEWIDEFSHRISKFTYKELQKKIRIGSSSLHKYKYGLDVPKVENIKKILRYIYPPEEAKIMYAEYKRLELSKCEFFREPPPETLCWSCNRNLVNGGKLCSWIETLTPVKGWTAEPKERENGRISYLVTKCPLHIPIPKKQEKMSEDPADYSGLAFAIVKKAIEDYMYCMADLPFFGCANIKYEKMELTKFFRSKWFEVLSDIDTKYFFEQMRKLSKQKEIIYDIRKNRKKRRWEVFPRAENKTLFSFKDKESAKNKAAELQGCSREWYKVLRKKERREKRKEKI